MSDTPSFDIDTISQLRALRRNAEDTHDRQLGPPAVVDNLTCPLCGDSFESTQAKGSHMTYKHSTLSDTKVFDSDVVMVAFSIKSTPLRDDERGLYYYPNSIKIPEGFEILHIDSRYKTVDRGNYHDQVIDVILVRANKLSRTSRTGPTRAKVSK